MKNIAFLKSIFTTSLSVILALLNTTEEVRKWCVKHPIVLEISLTYILFTVFQDITWSLLISAIAVVIALIVNALIEKTFFKQFIDKIKLYFARTIEFLNRLKEQLQGGDGLGAFH